jgi:hypothetical protein
MKLSIKALILVASVALCLMVAPAFSVPSDDQNSTSSMCGKIPACMGSAGKMGLGDNGSCAGYCTDNASMKRSPLWVMPVYYSGDGFAMSGSQDSQYHILKMSIASLVIFDSAKIENLISDNKTLGQIKSDIKTELYSEMDAAPANGSLKLGNSFYMLSNVKSKTVSADNSTIDADIVGPVTIIGNSSASLVAGHLSMAIAKHEGSTIGKGKLTMNSGNYSGEYDALIKIESERRDSKRFEMRKPGLERRS